MPIIHGMPAPLANSRTGCVPRRRTLPASIKNKSDIWAFPPAAFSTLLAAADHPNVKIWVGLDPVDRDGIGLAALPRLQAQAVILRADPSSWNAQGNARSLIAALGTHCQSDLIAGAIHIDAKWPTDALAELACGKSSDQYRAAFAAHALAALKAAMPSH